MQGFGNVGSVAAYLLADQGCRIVGVGDIYGAVYNPRGVDPRQVLAHVQETGRVPGLPGAEALGSAELL